MSLLRVVVVALSSAVVLLAGCAFGVPTTNADANNGSCTTCEAIGAECGEISDGCGGTLDCGDCTESGEVCGGGGTDNVCGACVIDCTGYSCGEAEPCGSKCGDKCDPGCTGHCSNLGKDCDEEEVDCGGDDCIPCDCTPNCTGLSCGQIEPICGATCGDRCDPGCTGHCTSGGQDCDETGVDCGGAACAACNCVPNCAGFSCGQIEPTCGTACGSKCDAGCTAHCSNSSQDCDETGVDCGGSTCAACACVPDCAGYSCGQIEPTCGTACGNNCDAGCTAHCSNSSQDCDETGVDCGGGTCSACGGCGDTCWVHSGSCSSAFIDACDGCDMGCDVHDPDCDDPGSTCLDACPCLEGYSHWYCDGWNDCDDCNCECDDVLADSTCVSSCNDPCFTYSGSCSSAYLGACDGCDMGCENDDPDCENAACLDECPCLFGYSSWYCDGIDDCTDPDCECAGE